MSTFLAGLIGTAIGAIVAGVVTYFVSPRIQQRIRQQERSERALERLLEVVEGEHWPRVVAYGTRLDNRSSLFATGTATNRSIRREEEHLGALTIELQESVRQLRLYTTRILDTSVVESFDNYTKLTLQAAALVGFMQVFDQPPRELKLVEFEQLEESLVALLRAANKALSCEWRDPRDVTLDSSAAYG
jgi:hypothetical protein